MGKKSRARLRSVPDVEIKTKDQTGGTNVGEVTTTTAAASAAAQVVEKVEENANLRTVSHMRREDFLEWKAAHYEMQAVNAEARLVNERIAGAQARLIAIGTRLEATYGGQIKVDFGDPTMAITRAPKSAPA